MCKKSQYRLNVPGVQLVFCTGNRGSDVMDAFRSVFRRVFVPFLVLLLVGCGGRERTEVFPGAWESVRAVVDHSRQPLSAPWNCSVTLEIGEASGADEYILRSPFALTVLPGGLIVIEDDRPLQLRVYDSRGGHVSSFGQPGGGPGDLTPGRFRWVMRPLDERTFQLWSGWPPRVQEWTVDGELLGVQSLRADHPMVLGTAPLTIGFIDDELYWVARSHRLDHEGRSIGTSHILVGDIQGTAADTLTSIRHEPMPTEYQLALQFGLDYAYLLDDHILVTRDRKCYLTSWLEDWVTEVDLQRGVPVLRFRWEHEPDAIPVAVSERMDRQLDAASRDMLVEGLTWLQERVSLLGLAEGPEGRILVQRTGEPVDENWPTDVFGPDGRYLDRVLLPVEPRTAVLSGRDLIGLGIRQGVPVIRVVRLGR